jgi:hypothetical protein
LKDNEGKVLTTEEETVDLMAKVGVTKSFDVKDELKFEGVFVDVIRQPFH